MIQRRLTLILAGVLVLSPLSTLAQLGETALACLAGGACQGNHPPVGACNRASPLYTDTSTTPPVIYSCFISGWVPTNTGAGGGGGAVLPSSQPGIASGPSGAARAQTLADLQTITGNPNVGVDTTNAANIMSGTLGVARVPSLDASKITTGTFATGQIPALDAAKITTGTFSTAQIPSLDAGQTTSGVFSAFRIPSIDLLRTDATKSAAFGGGAGTGGNTTCPAPAAGNSYLCAYADGHFYLSDNGAAYTLLSPGSSPSIPQAATPTASPAPGTYTSTQSVTLADTTSGAAIRYTTDGSTPTSASTLYSAAIAVPSSLTIKAFAQASGFIDSAVGTFVYTISGGGGGSGPQFYSRAAGSNTASLTSVPAGSVILVHAVNFANQTATISDSSGNTPAVVSTWPQTWNGGGGTEYFWTVTNASAGTHNLTVTWNGGAYYAMQAVVVSGANATTPIDASSHYDFLNSTGGVNIACGSLTSTGTNRLAVGFIYEKTSPGPSAGTSPIAWTLAGAASDQLQSEYAGIASASTFSPTWSYNSANAGDYVSCTNVAVKP